MLLRASRLRWLAFVTFAVTVGCSGPRDKPEQTSVAEKPTAPATEKTVSENVLDRVAVILNALRAAPAAAALGNDDRAAQEALKGRKFEIRLRFACPGMTDPSRTATYDAKEQVLRAKVRSDLTRLGLGTWELGVDAESAIRTPSASASASGSARALRR